MLVLRTFMHSHWHQLTHLDCTAAVSGPAACVALMSDSLNCGACGVQCSTGAVCSSGTCSPITPSLPPGGDAAAASISLGPFSICDRSGNALATTTRCGTASTVPAVSISITQSMFETLAVSPKSPTCLRVSTCNQAQLGNTVTDTTLSWTPPDVYEGWPAAVSSCSQSNCGDGSTLSQMILPNSGRNETVWLAHPAGSCLDGVRVLLTVSPDCTL